MRDESAERAHVADALRNQLASRAEILFAYLHGSFVGGGSYRDIDVAVWLDPSRVPSAARLSYALELAVHLQTALKQTVDVQVLNEAALAFRYHALDGVPLVVRDGELRDEVMARTWDEYIDFQPFARQYLREVLR